MAFGLGLPPHKYILDKLGTELRGCYEHLIAEGEPEHLRVMLQRLRARG